MSYQQVDMPSRTRAVNLADEARELDGIESGAGLTAYSPPLLAGAPAGAVAASSGDALAVAPLGVVESRNKLIRCGFELLLIVIAIVLAYLVGRASVDHHGPPTPGPAPGTRAPPTIVVSFDGLRPSYLSPEATPHMWALRSQRSVVYADRMQAQFPSLTFPNHYSLVTGLVAESHGITANHIINPDTGNRFVYTNTSTQTSEWFLGKPIWNLAQEFNVSAGTVFWVGSETLIGGHRPNVWLPYNDAMTSEARVDQVFEWIDSGACQLCMVYFSAVDTAGHAYGPDSAEVAKAVREMDGVVGRIEEKLAARSLTDRANLVLVSDHGMSPVQNYIYLDDHLDLTTVSKQESGAFLDLWPQAPATVESVLAALAPVAHLRCWAKDSVPDYNHFQNSNRIAPIVCVCDDTWVTSARDPASPFWFPTSLKGMHGYMPDLPNMGATFVVRAPSQFDSGVDGQAGRLAQTSNLNVFNLICHLLQISPSPNNGTLTDFAPFMRTALGL